MSLIETLTRSDVLRLLKHNDAFMIFLRQIKTTAGYSRDRITYVDDSVTHGNSTVGCTDVIATIRLHKTSGLIQDVPWIYPGFSDSRWGRTCTQQPFYIKDSMVHLSGVGQGAVIHTCCVGSRFDNIIREEQLVYFNTDSTLGVTEAHIHLTIAELDALQ